MRPCIGISAYWRVASFGAWSAMPVALVPQGYVVAIQAAGGVALLVPPDPAYAGDAEVLDALDGLVVVGGEDVEPSRYAAETKPGTDVPNVLRDGSELALLRGALARDLPVLGICRGLQLINVVYGGDLVQELATVVDGAPHRVQPGVFGRHDVDVAGGALGRLYGARVEQVHSHHHQAIGRVGDGLAVTARAADGLIEGLEDPARDFCVGVLWHPEEAPTTTGAPLFEALVEQAAARRAAR